MKQHEASTCIIRNGIYKCCHGAFQTHSKAALTMHFAKNHPGNCIPMQCPYCPFVTEYFFYIPDHIEAKHKNGEPDNRGKHINCLRCNKELADEIKLIAHDFAYHSEETVIQCPQCELSTSVAESFLSHFGLHRKIKWIYGCRYCRATYGEVRKVRKHEQQHNPSDPLFERLVWKKEYGSSDFIDCDILLDAGLHHVRDNTGSSDAGLHHVRGNTGSSAAIDMQVEKYGKEITNQDKDKSNSSRDLKIENKGKEECERTDRECIPSKISKRQQVSKERECPHCQFTAKDALLIARHMAQLHNDNWPAISCEECEYVCKTRFNMVNHYMSKHRDKNISAVCPSCNELICYKFYLQDHITGKHTRADGLLRCNKCDDFKVGSDGAFIAHDFAWHSETSAFICPNCSVFTSDSSYFYKHFKYCYLKAPRQDGQISKQTKFYTCTKCSFEARKKTHLELHEFTDHFTPTQLFSCSDCDFKTNFRTSLVRHTFKVHLGQLEAAQCSFCQFTTKYKVYLADHVMAMHGNNNHKYFCQVCSFKCRKLVRFVSHDFILHSEDGTMKCPSCDYKFTGTNHLLKHLKHFHLPEIGLYQCATCPYSAINNDTFSKHVCFNTSKPEEMLNKKNVMNEFNAVPDMDTGSNSESESDSMDDVDAEEIKEVLVQKKATPVEDKIKKSHSLANFNARSLYVPSLYKTQEAQICDNLKIRSMCLPSLNGTKEAQIHDNLKVTSMNLQSENEIKESKTHDYPNIKSIYPPFVKETAPRGRVNKEPGMSGIRNTEIETRRDTFLSKRHSDNGPEDPSCMKRYQSSSYRGAIIECEECPYVTRHKSSMTLHYKHRHLDSCVEIVCGVCPFKTFYKFYLPDHMEGKHGSNDGWLICHTCGKFRTRMEMELIAHDFAYHSEMDYVKCPECNYDIPKGYMFYSHFMDKHMLN